MNIQLTKKQNLGLPANFSEFWKQGLITTQIFDKNYTYLPEVNACRLRIAYSKLQSANNKIPKKQFKLQQLQKTKGSFLLDKTSRNVSLNLSINKNEQNSNIRMHDQNNNTRYNKIKYISIQSPRLIRTIDVAQIKKISISKRNLSKNLSNSGSLKRSKEFAEYFKKIISNQKINNEPNRLFSQGKGLDISDRANFEKYQRVKLSILNQKIIQKQHSFQCVSSKLNDYRINYPHLPDLKRKQQNTKKSNKKSQQKIYEQQQQYYGFQPWQNDSNFNDIQQ